MNPEDNNPLVNSGIPDLGIPAAPTDLTAPISTDLSGMSGLTGLGSDSGVATPPENPFAPVAEEPLVPAAPVPGSIGSVTSVPADVTPAPAPIDPLAPSAAPAPAPTNPLSAPAATSAPAPAPYNPFAQPSTTGGAQATAPASAPVSPSPADVTPAPAPIDPSTSAVPTPTPTPMPASAPTMAPPVQPTAAPKMKKAAGSSSMTVIFAIVAILGIIVAIVFAILYFNASKSPKVVYVPSISEDDTNDTMQILTCTKPSDFDYLIGYGREVTGNVSVVADYTNDKLSALEFDYNATFDSEGDASVASENFAASFNTQGVLVGTQSIDGNTMKSNYKLIEGMDLTDSMAQGLIYGEGAVDQDLSISGVEAYYTASGFSCSVE